MFSPKTTLPYAALPAGTDTLQNWATNAGIPNLAFIPAGSYLLHIHALRTGGGTVTLHAQFWEVSSTGVDIAMIGQTGDTPALGTSEVEYIVDFSDSNTYTMASAASRIVARVFAVVSGSAPTVQIFVGGTADSHLALPSNTVDASNFVPYTGATRDVDLGTHALIQTGVGVTTTISTTVVPHFAGLWASSSPSTFNYAFLSNGPTTLFNTSAGGTIEFRINNSSQLFMSPAGLIGIQTNSPTYSLDVSKGVGLSGTARFFDQTATTGSTLVTITPGAAQTSASTILDVQGVAAVVGLTFNGHACSLVANVVTCP